MLRKLLRKANKVKVRQAKKTECFICRFENEKITKYLHFESGQTYLFKPEKIGAACFYQNAAELYIKYLKADNANLDLRAVEIVETR